MATALRGSLIVFMALILSETSKAGFPRLHFSGSFLADTSTLNNDPDNFNIDNFDINRDPPCYFDTYPHCNWNPKGTNDFRLVNCSVTKICYKNGKCTKSDPIVGKRITGSDDTVAAKMVDLDPYLYATQLWGLVVGVEGAFQGKFKVSTVRDQWQRCKEDCPMDSGSSGYWSSVLENVTWFDQENSNRSKKTQTNIDFLTFIHQLKFPREESSPAKTLNVKFTVDMMNEDPRTPNFAHGRVIGSISSVDDVAASELGFPEFNRMLWGQGVDIALQGQQILPEMKDYYHAPFYMDRRNMKVVVDLSNSLPTRLNGTLVDRGNLFLLLLHNRSSLQMELGRIKNCGDILNNPGINVGAISYTADKWLSQDAGIVTLDMDMNTKMDEFSMVMVVKEEPPPCQQCQKQCLPILAEHPDGLCIDVIRDSTRKQLLNYLQLPIEDPNHMPVTRDLSPAKRDIILDWLDKADRKYSPRQTETTVSQLRENLQLALRLEWTTVPLYLSSYYSIKDGFNTEVASLLKSIVVEEMHHMSLVANILNAIGGKPVLNDPNIIPTYPGPLPGGCSLSIPIQLSKCSRDQIHDVFMAVEMPECKGQFFDTISIPDTIVSLNSSFPSNQNLSSEWVRNCTAGPNECKDLLDDASNMCKEEVKNYQTDTIGAMYIHKILCPMINLHKSGNLTFIGDTTKQYPSPFCVTDLCTTILAIHQIVGQGKGGDPCSPFYKGLGGKADLSHYYKFAEVVHGKALVEANHDKYDVSYNWQNKQEQQQQNCDGSDKNTPGHDFFTPCKGHICCPKKYEFAGSPIPFYEDAVWPTLPNPRSSKYPPGSKARKMSDHFNQKYTSLIKCLHEVFNGYPKKMRHCFVLMSSLTAEAKTMVQTPIDPDGDPHVGPNVAPTFEWPFRMGNLLSEEEKTPLDVTDVDDPQDRDFGNYDFPFENLVIEGGGARGVAYVGALRVLETAGILKNIKRVAGVSAGAITATFVALGLSCADVAKQADVDLGKILISGGYLKTLVKPVNLYWRYGWETGDGFYTFFGGILEKFTRLFQPVLTDYHGNKEFYVDGGVICNYPLHSFDGWWLSMGEDDSFFHRLDDLAHLSRSFHRSNRFEPVNPKTIGLLLYSDNDIEEHQQVLIDRLTQEERLYKKKRPDTRAAREYQDKRIVETVEAMENRKKIRGLIDKFLTILKAQNKDHTSTVSREELHRALAEAGNNSLTDKEKEKLFGEAYSVDQLFDQMDANNDGELTFQEVHGFFTNRGFSWLTRSMEEKRQHVSSLTDYTMKYMSLLGVLGKKVYKKVDDIERTIGVDSDYVMTTDFQLEDEDKMFLFQRGATGVRAFLRTYIAKNNLKPTKSVGKRRWKNLQRHVLFAPRPRKVAKQESRSNNL
uniref:Calmodulin n=1 Tax=Branchiostoma floridae TaxID=7739 RepID=C3ZH49_BRAFL|eukprot:XP_002592185.1 hypothetical protein BRAFLDRAFT_88078 [Branchiostoma floridae]